MANQNHLIIQYIISFSCWQHKNMCSWISEWKTVFCSFFFALTMIRCKFKVRKNKTSISGHDYKRFYSAQSAANRLEPHLIFYVPLNKVLRYLFILMKNWNRVQRSFNGNLMSAEVSLQRNWMHCYSNNKSRRQNWNWREKKQTMSPKQRSFYYPLLRCGVDQHFKR